MIDKIDGYEIEYSTEGLLCIKPPNQKWRGISLSEETLYQEIDRLRDLNAAVAAEKLELRREIEELKIEHDAGGLNEDKAVE